MLTASSVSMYDGNKNAVLSMTLNFIKIRDSSTEGLGSVEYPFITVTPKSTQTQRRRTYRFKNVF